MKFIRTSFFKFQLTVFHLIRINNHATEFIHTSKLLHLSLQVIIFVMQYYFRKPIK